MQLCCLRGTLCLLLLVTCSRDQDSAIAQSQFHTSSFLHPRTMQVCAVPGMQCSIGYYCVPGSLSLLICDLLRRKDTVPYFKAYRFPYRHPSLSVFAALSAAGEAPLPLGSFLSLGPLQAPPERESPAPKS